MKTWSNRPCLTVTYPLLAGILLISPATQSMSAEQELLKDIDTVESLNITTVNTSQWANWILSQVQSLPAIKAQEAEIQKEKELSIAKQQPLYNPELSLSYTEKQEDEYDIILSQTIDWYNKRSKQASLGQLSYDLSLINKRLAVENKLAQVLFSFVEYSKEQRLLSIAKQQEQLLDQFYDDLKVREKLGDVSSMDAEMAYLSITQNLQQISLGEIRYLKSLSALHEELNTQTISYQPDLSIWENNLSQSNLKSFIKTGLKYQLSKIQLEQSRSLSEITKLDSKNNPTVGLGVGREGDDNQILFEFSIPLNINNNYSAQYRASLKQVTQSELELDEQQRVLAKQIKQSFDNYHEVKSRVLKWKKLTTHRAKESKKVLTKLWQSGDIKTSDYLFALRQRTDSMISNIELMSQMQKAWIEWLQVSNQIESWLTHLIQKKENRK